MTAPVSQVLSEAEGPREIWLSPVCDDWAHHGEGRTWAAPAPEYECECDEGGHPWVKYVRADLATAPAALAKEQGR